MTLAEQLTFVSVFILGLAHTLEPCEDKAVVSIYAVWGSKRQLEGMILVILYGLGMAVIDTFLGFLVAIVGVNVLERFWPTLELVAGAITIAFGLFMLSGKSPAHLTHHHDGSSESFVALSRLGALAFGIVRGLPPCPFELAVFLWAASVGSVLAGTLMVFIFGIGTTVGLIPLGLLLGTLSGTMRKRRYYAWIPKICGAVVVTLGLILTLQTIFALLKF